MESQLNRERNKQRITAMGKRTGCSRAFLLFSLARHLQFQSGSLVVTLWFHEEPECEKALKVLQQICPVADRPPQGQGGAVYAQNQPPQQQPQTHQFAPQQPQQQQPPVVKPNPQQPYQPYTMQQQPQSQQHQFAQQPSQSQQPAYVSTQPAPSASPPASAPKLAFISPYAPPPPVAYNVALPSASAGGSGGRPDDRELAARLQGFVAQVHQADGQHTAEYQRALAEEEERRRRNVQRFQEEEKRKKEAERAAQPPPSSASAPPPAATSAIFPRMLTADQHLMLQQFPSSSNIAPPGGVQPQPLASPVAAAAPVDGLDRNLAAAKARKAARQQAAAQQNQPQQQQMQQQQPSYSPSMGPSAYTPAAASSLPLSLLLAAANSSSNPPMPVLNSSQQSAAAAAASSSSSSYAAMTASSSPIVGPIRSPPLHAAPQSSPLAPTSTAAPAAAALASDLHPQLLAMLSLSVANQSAALPPMPVLSSQAAQPATVVPASSPYAARASPDSFVAAPAPAVSAAAAATPVLLAPSHFLTSTAPTSSVAPASSPSSAASTAVAAVPRGPIPAAPTKLRTASEFKDYLLFLCNDPATFDWLYQKYLANPQQHPFA